MWDNTWDMPRQKGELQVSLLAEDCPGNLPVHLCNQGYPGFSHFQGHTPSQIPWEHISMNGETWHVPLVLSRPDPACLKNSHSYSQGQLKPTQCLPGGSWRVQTTVQMSIANTQPLQNNSTNQCCSHKFWTSAADQGA